MIKQASLESVELVDGEITSAQKELIDEICSELCIRFEGKTKLDAIDFISEYVDYLDDIYDDSNDLYKNLLGY